MTRRIGYPVRWLVGRLHISTDYGDVARDISDRIADNIADGGRWTPDERVKCITDALIEHRRNRRLYDEIFN